ncbi:MULTISPECIES: CBS domain-containing protein [Amycolatopsis]|uniref:CBS domain-containing protein n=1 Tax=Amycolatopsis dendrobii TaxID=2760662 RepID=A0A7W3ZFJ6_9PSEU|nr:MULTISPECIES: CBS domain-containing protein [Amycolatopsis]MBB1159555.1 CBS domain-containing protein [Amycolatopsis dendrobii]UKD57363.1 CBS domain-containing protein [Amycolatopsis sp. FU40]
MPEPEPSVADVVVRLPKTLPAHASVAEARACFADDHVHLLLFTDSGRLLGTLVREDLDDSACGPALRYARLAGRTVPADLPAEAARRLLLRRGQRRLAVINRDGALLGLLCLKRRRTGFCSDADVAARAADRLR